MIERVLCAFLNGDMSPNVTARMYSIYRTILEED